MIQVLVTLVSVVITALAWSLFQSKDTELLTYTYETKQRIKSLEDELAASKDQLQKISESNNVLFEDKLSNHNKEVSDYEGQIQQHKNEISQLQSKLSDQQKSEKSKDASIQSHLDEINKVNKKLSEVEGEKLKLETKFRFDLNQKIEELITDRDLKITNQQKRILDLEATLAERSSLFEKVVAKSVEKVSEYGRQNASLEKAVSDKQREIADLTKKIDLIQGDKNELATTKSDLQELRTKIETVTRAAAVPDLDKLLESAKKSAVLAKGLEQKDITITELERARSELQNKIDSSKQASDATESQLRDTQAKLDSLTKEFKLQEHKLESFDLLELRYVSLFEEFEEFIPDLDSIEVEATEMKKVHQIVAGLHTLIEDTSESHSNKHQELKQLKEDYESLKASELELTQEKRKLTEQVAEYEKSHNSFKETHDLNQKLVTEFKNKLKESAQQIQESQQELERKTQEVEELVKDYKLLDAARKVQDTKMVKDEEEKNTLAADKSKLEAANETLEEKIQRVENIIEEKQDRITALEQTVQKLQGTIKSALSDLRVE